MQETILKRAADLAEVLYSMPRSHNQLALPTAARSPAGAMAATPGAAAAAVVGSGFNSYAGPLTGAVAATVICYIMWCGCCRQTRLLTLNCLPTGQRSHSSRTRLRVKPRVVEYVSALHSLDAAGGPPVCYLSDESRPTTLTGSDNVSASRVGGTF